VDVKTTGLVASDVRHSGGLAHKSGVRRFVIRVSCCIANSPFDVTVFNYVEMASNGFQNYPCGILACARAHDLSDIRQNWLIPGSSVVVCSASGHLAYPCGAHGTAKRMHGTGSNSA
jgi:hypothetical protein